MLIELHHNRYDWRPYSRNGKRNFDGQAGAFRIIPVHPEDQCLLGMQWQNMYYIDRVLPFGLRSAPRLFSAVADALQFVAITQGIKNIADDFIIHNLG